MRKKKCVQTHAETGLQTDRQADNNEVEKIAVVSSESISGWFDFQIFEQFPF